MRLRPTAKCSVFRGMRAFSRKRISGREENREESCLCGAVQRRLDSEKGKNGSTVIALQLAAPAQSNGRETLPSLSQVPQKTERSIGRCDL